MSEATEILKMAWDVHNAVAYKLTAGLATKARIVANELNRTQAALAVKEKQIKRLIQWKKQVPDKSGHWLRVNARGAVVYHKVFENYFGKLSIYWGWSPRNKCIVKDIAHKLKQFCWLGPLSEPPEQALGGKNSKETLHKKDIT